MDYAIDSVVALLLCITLAIYTILAKCPVNCACEGCTFALVAKYFLQSFLIAVSNSLKQDNSSPTQYLLHDYVCLHLYNDVCSPVQLLSPQSLANTLLQPTSLLSIRKKCSNGICSTRDSRCKSSSFTFSQTLIINFRFTCINTELPNSLFDNKTKARHYNTRRKKSRDVRGLFYRRQTSSCRTGGVL